MTQDVEMEPGIPELFGSLDPRTQDSKMDPGIPAIKILRWSPGSQHSKRQDGAHDPSNQDSEMEPGIPALKMLRWEAGEMAQRLRAPTTLAEDPGSIPITHMMAKNNL